MRCKYCGSTSIHAATEHRNFSAGKAVAGAVTFGVVGVAAGFIGKIPPCGLSIFDVTVK